MTSDRRRMLLCTKPRPQRRACNDTPGGWQAFAGAASVPEQYRHRFAVEVDSQRFWVTLHQEQMDAVLCGERRVVEANPRAGQEAAGRAWWYFHDSAIGLLRVEIGARADDAQPRWEGRIHDAYVGRLCSVLLL